MEAAEAYADVAHLKAPADIIAFARERDAIASAQEYIRSLAGSADHNLRRGGAE